MSGPGGAEQVVRNRLIQQRVDQTQTFLDDAQRNLAGLGGAPDVRDSLIAAAHAQAALATVVALTRIAEALEAA